MKNFPMKNHASLPPASGIAIISLIFTLMIAVTGLAQANADDPRERLWSSRDLQEYFATGNRERIEAVVGPPQRATEDESFYDGFRVSDSPGEESPVSVKIRWKNSEGEELPATVELVSSP